MPDSASCLKELSPCFVKVKATMAESRFFSGHEFEHVAVTASTNDDLKQHREESCKTEKLLVADLQTAGRGQFDRKWQAGNREALLFSFSFPCMVDAKPWSLLVAVVLHEAIIDIFPDSRSQGIWLKWPNDVWLGNGKLAGILVEGAVAGGMRHMVAGVGLNLLRPTFSGICGAGLLDRPDDEARADVLCSFIKAWDSIVALEPEKIINLWKNAAGMFWKHTFRFEIPDGEMFVARPVDILPDGRIVVVDQKGRSRIIASASLKPEAV